MKGFVACGLSLPHENKKPPASPLGTGIPNAAGRMSVTKAGGRDDR